MKTNTLLSLLSAHLKAVTVAGVAIAATAGGGAVVATTVSNDTPATVTATDSTTPTVTNTDSPDPQETETDSPDPQETDSPDSNAVNSANSTQSPFVCGTATYANHGAYVSSVAHSTPTPGSSPNQHGKDVSFAAQGGCATPTDTASTGTAAPAGTTDTQSTVHGQGATHRNANANKVHGQSASHRHHH